MLPAMKRVLLPCGESVPTLGQGTWNIGDDPARRGDEIAALQRGIDLGLTLVDTAEMYGDGRSESLVGAAIAGRRDAVFLVSKVYPHNASKKAMPRSCEASLRRLGVEAIDLYLLHWEGSVPIAETVAAFEALQRQGKIRHWGVSNLDADAMQALWQVEGGASVQTDQVLYNLGRRGIEWDLVPWLRERRVALMAYSPIEQGRLLRQRGLVAFARKRAMTPAQAALAWLLAQDGVIAIPKTGRRARLEENSGALAHPLSADDLRELDGLFPPPRGPSPLAMI
jgi:diketogulonate reductase-like aldo/keto reductase